MKPNDIAFMHDGANQFAITMYPSVLRGLVLSLAESLRVESQYRENERLFDDQGKTNELVTIATFIYAFVKGELQNPYQGAFPELFSSFSDERDKQKRTITDALSAFQSYKTAICKAEQAEMGENWGSATGFFQKDWTDLNGRFLSVL